ncbi:Bro-N domain-containing protein [Candidatus Woesearchaeota archaeon]|nr:Bro-N domain-containing protein [Candidatus Woesearchaeota archaeon]
METGLVVFRDRAIRRIQHKGEWYFSVVDIVRTLTESPSPRQYWGVLKGRETQLLTICLQLKLPSVDGKFYATDCVNTESAFRLIQSIPSKKAEPFKLWLAQVGYERVEEIQNPELAQKRMRKLYKAKGYSNAWIEKRVRGIAIRDELTDEWKNREVKTAKEFAILTNEISKATFGKTVGEYKEFKSLKKKNQNLRDHMNDWELILTMIGEKATTDITKETDSQGLHECKESANKGGNIAKRTRKDIEGNIGKSIISEENFLPQKKRLKLRK